MPGQKASGCLCSLSIHLVQPHAECPHRESDHGANNFCMHAIQTSRTNPGHRSHQVSRQQPQRPHIVALANQKGGVGKTTTAINLSAALAETGHRVLLIDLDPQGNASTGLGVLPSARALSAFDLLTGDNSFDEIVQPTQTPSLWLIPASESLISAHLALADTAAPNACLKSALARGLSHLRRWDYVFIDCPPAMNLLAVNALVSADGVLIPMQSEYFAFEGLSQMIRSMRELRRTLNPALRTEGVLLTMFDARIRLAREVEAEARAHLGRLVYRTRIPRNVKLIEAASFGKSILEYAAWSRGAVAYRELAREFMLSRRAGTK